MFVGGVRIPMEARVLLENDYPPDWFTMPLEAIEDLMRPKRDALASLRSIGAMESKARDALAAVREPDWLERKAHSRERVNQLEFDPSGDRLFAATEGGLRVYLWRECMEAGAEMPPPILAVRR